MQTIESLEENNSELHLKINHLGQLSINAEDLKDENSRLKTCDHCQFEFTSEQSFKEHIMKLLVAQNTIMRYMEEENINLFNEKSYFKNVSEQAFLRSKNLEKVFQITVQDLKQTLQDKEKEIQNMKAEIINSKAAPQEALQAAPQEDPQAAPQQALQDAPQQVTAPEMAPHLQTIWHPPGHPPIIVDECVQNVSCKGNCEHVQGHNIEAQEELKVTCHDCKQRFKDKVSMMNHKRDSDHPSKKKCNKFPDCERTEGCWYIHGTQVITHTNPQGAQENTTFICNVCEQVFTSRNEMMFHKKRIHPSDILCSNFLNGYCRRGISGEFCWYRHENQSTVVQSVARPQINLPPPGSSSWNMDFPQHPTMGLSSVVGIQKQMMGVLQQQIQEQQRQQHQHQQQMSVLMNQLVNLNM